MKEFNCVEKKRKTKDSFNHIVKENRQKRNKYIKRKINNMSEKDIDQAVEKKFGHKNEMFETNSQNKITVSYLIEF